MNYLPGYIHCLNELSLMSYLQCQGSECKVNIPFLCTYVQCLCMRDVCVGLMEEVLFASVHFIVQVCFLLRSYKRSLSMSFEENKGRGILFT